MAEEITSELMNDILTDTACNFDFPTDTHTGIQNDNNSNNSNSNDCFDIFSRNILVHNLHNEGRKEHG